ncbi:secretion protein HlyD [Selenomonas sp. oral taxon 126]|uniref:secretion protein HlyD n=1 Tax=Selenomonas sp. oral taxon 126 TaxID=712528 RepID=UPI000A05FA16|nr:secretion protein HlyD [Selenomonas sp. oral taxon 126]
MKSVGLVQIFCPVKETNRTHSKGYVEDLSTQTGRKRCAKTARLNLSVLPYQCFHKIASCRKIW